MRYYAPLVSLIVCLVLSPINAHAGPGKQKSFTFVGVAAEIVDGSSAGSPTQTFIVTPSLSAPKSITVLTDFGSNVEREIFSFAKGKVTYKVNGSVLGHASVTKKTARGKTTISFKINGGRFVDTVSYVISSNLLKSTFVAKVSGFNDVMTTKLSCSAAIQPAA